jgi:hypothetical protein
VDTRSLTKSFGWTSA